MKPIVAYIRVSTSQQGRSGLGIEAQRAAIVRFADAEGFEVAAEFVEIETGKGSDALDRRRALISERTKSALAAAKARGVKLGNPHIDKARTHGVAAIKAEADRAAANVLPVIREIQASGVVALNKIAEALNARGIPTPRGGRWYAMSVRNVLARGPETGGQTGCR